MFPRTNSGYSPPWGSDLKAKETVTAIDRQKLLSYLRLSDKKLGLIINFHVVKLKNGVERIVNGLTE